jgi:hypothetical protein
MIKKTKRDAAGNTRYPTEHTHPALGAGTDQSALSTSQQFADTTATLGVASRGFHFTGMTTDNQGHDAAIHSSKSLLNDSRSNNEAFIDNRSGSQARPAFKDNIGPITTGPVPSGTDFTPSTAEPAAQGAGGAGPSWWDRIKTNFRGQSTQSSNLGVNPPNAFQVGLRAGNVAVVAGARPVSAGPVGVSSGSPSGAASAPAATLGFHPLAGGLQV